MPNGDISLLLDLGLLRSVGHCISILDGCKELVDLAWVEQNNTQEGKKIAMS